MVAAGGDLLQRADGPEAFGVTRRFIAGPPEAAAISDLLHGRSAGTSRPTDALAAGTGGGGDRPVVGSPAIPTASDLTRTSVRELIDGFAEPLLEGSSENCCPMVYRSALHPAVLAQPQPKGSGSPRAHNKPEFGPGAPVAATLRTDWGVVAWHRAAFRLFWTWKVRCGKPGRPVISSEVRDLIRKMCRENPGWGAPRIHGEVLKLGIDIGQSSVSKSMVRCRKPPSQTWRTFLENHAQQLVSIDFFTVPTIRFQVLYVCLVLAHDRRRMLHFNVTAHPTADWTGQQLREAFPFAQLPRYLLRDHDAIFGDDFREHVRDMGICEVLSAPRSPWQRAYIERVIGSVRRECLDHVIVFHESSLRRTLNSYFDYYHRSRTHLSLGKDSPEPRAIQPPEMGSVVALPQVGGLHHRYERRAA